MEIVKTVTQRVGKTVRREIIDHRVPLADIFFNIRFFRLKIIDEIKLKKT